MVKQLFTRSQLVYMEQGERFLNSNFVFIVILIQPALNFKVARYSRMPLNYNNALRANTGAILALIFDSTIILLKINIILAHDEKN